MSKEKTFSLLKKRTNYDKIKRINLNEMAEFLDYITDCCANENCEQCPLLCGVCSMKQWLESEAEE